MLFPERRKTLPHLADYLTQAASNRSLPAIPDDLSMMFGGSTLAASAVGFATYAASGFHSLLVGIVAAVGGFAIAFAGSVRYNQLVNKDKPIEDERRIERDSRAVIMRLHLLMHKKRLHRDLSPDVAELLEQAAMEWARARAALMSPYWTRADLNSRLGEVRERSLKAIERSMQELLILYATAVPEQPGNWSIAEVVDEVVGKGVFASPPTHRFSPFHGEAVRIVDQLAQMADEAERVSRQVVSDPEMAGDSRPGSRLEATLADLRQMRIAEDELREDLRH